MSDELTETTMILSSSPILVDARDAAKLLGIGRTLFLQMDASGRLGPMGLKFGKRRLFVVEELRQWCLAGVPRREIWMKLKEEQNEPFVRSAKHVI